MSTAVASQIKDFTGGWGKGKGSGAGTRSREFEFTAYIGQYNGGNWNSTVRVAQGNKIETGSLPNLLYLMSAWSKDKIKTNYQNVRAIKLDSDEIFSVKPPFIFLTGTKDFKLSDREVENLQKYVRMGGCIWGDSSLPGLRSRFDIAFRREMKRVIPDVDKNFESLPPNHPIYTEGYFADIKEVPPGLNYYQEPVFAIKVYGEIAILYTANDYGDMWQIGLTQGWPDRHAQERRRQIRRHKFRSLRPPGRLFAQHRARSALDLFQVRDKRRHPPFDSLGEQSAHRPNALGRPCVRPVRRGKVIVTPGEEDIPGGTQRLRDGGVFLVPRRQRLGAGGRGGGSEKDWLSSHRGEVTPCAAHFAIDEPLRRNLRRIVT